MVALAAMWWAPSWWAGRYAGAWFDNDPAVIQPMADGLYATIEQPLSAGDYGTGSARFDSEWHWGTYFMAAMAFSQLGQLDRAEVALEHMLDPQAHAFDTEAWGVHADDDPTGHHAALVGYGNLALSVYREAGGQRFHDVNDRWTARLEVQFQSEPDLLLTYPGETYAVDNAAGLASIAVHARVSGRDLPWWDAEMAWFEAQQVSDGLLYQSGQSRLLRGSGTTLAAYFFSHARHPLADTLAEGAVERLYDTTWGFGALREYPPGVDGHGDIDSGPLIVGYSISASGFGLASARRTGDRARFRRLFATVWIFGAPTWDRTRFMSGGPLGNAILLAMMTGPT